MENILTLQNILEYSAKSDPNKEAIFDGYKRISYQQLLDDVECLAAALTQLNIRKGDRVMVSLPNWHEFVTIYFSLAKIGAILVPCNTRYQVNEISYILENSRAKAVFLIDNDKNINVFEQYINKSVENEFEHIFTVRFTKEGNLSFEDLLELGKNKVAQNVLINPNEDVFSILYTSGTTGDPKGAMLTHHNVFSTAQISNIALDCNKNDVFLVAVPAFHVFGMVPSILSAIAVGGRIVFMEEFKAGKALQIIEQEKITIHHGVPTMFILELNHPTFDDVDLSSLKTGIIAAAPCPEEIVKKIRMKMGCNIVVSYGLTETSATLTVTGLDDDDRLRSETIGKPVPGAEVKIVDANREEVAPGEVGEIACRSNGVFIGYYNLPEKTSEAIDKDGWFYTGDLGTKDEQGYFRVVGRKKDLIIRGGYNIYPREIEELFYKHPSVLEVAIVGLPDTVLGEVACAAIKLKPNKVETEMAMRQFIEEQVADFKVPDRFVFLDELPMTPSGKIKKIALQEILRAKLQSSLR